jgi:hypothetical protein
MVIADVDNNEGNADNARLVHIPIFYDGSLPGAKGPIAKYFQTKYTSIQQKVHAREFHAFLTMDDVQPLELNADDIPRVALVNIPSSSKVRVVYGTGFGSRTIGQAHSSITSKFVMLNGEGGNDLGYPNVLTLPRDIITPNDIATMTIQQFSTKLTSKGQNYTYPLLARNKVTTTKSIMQLAPISPS